MNFSERLAKARKAKGFTQSNVAEKLNVSFQAVSQWETGGTMPETEKLIDLAEIYQVSLDWLLTGKHRKACRLIFRIRYQTGCLTRTGCIPMLKPMRA